MTRNQQSRVYGAVQGVILVAMTAGAAFVGGGLPAAVCAVVVCVWWLI